MRPPNFKKEKSLLSRGHEIVVGIDEAGRGPLAGPVTAAALAVIGPISNFKFLISKPRAAGQSSLRGRQHRNLRFLKDSKKLTPKKREEFYRILIRHPHICWATASAGPKMIDKINVARAADLAARRAFKKLAAQSLNGSMIPKTFILLDGSLSLPRKFSQETIVRGDEKIWSIAAASVIAKVTRDRKMRRLAKKIPGYGLEIHKGYGTKLHYRMLKKFGPSEVHRRSFLNNLRSRHS